MNKKVISALLCGAMVLGAATPVMAEGAGDGQKIALVGKSAGNAFFEIAAASFRGRYVRPSRRNRPAMPSRGAACGTSRSKKKFARPAAPTGDIEIKLQTERHAADKQHNQRPDRQFDEVNR